MNDFIWLDASLSIEERLEALMAALSLDEKISLLDNKPPRIERLAMPKIKYDGEVLHGLCNTGRATSFPMPVGMAATFDTALIEQVASATSDEMRAKYHSDAWNHAPSVSLVVYSPVINILRDPRWGRAQETFGEDPYLTGQMGAAYVRGLQGDNPDYLKLAACAKHLAVHSGPETMRRYFNAVVSKKDLMETYLPAFEDLVRAGVATVMATYNRVNGEHNCAHSFLIGEYLRKRLGFDGMVLSDGGALGSLHRVPGSDAPAHNLTADKVETAALCILNQCDMELGQGIYCLAGEALKRGILTEAEIDRAVRRNLRVSFKLGAFDAPDRVPYTKIPVSVIQCDKHIELARRCARESLVLLKNENDALPLRKERDKIVLVTGPTSVDLQVLLGNFYKGSSGRLVSFLEGITAEAPNGAVITHSQGCFLTHPNVYPSDWYLGLSDWASTVVACVGYSPLMEGEQGECIGAADGGDKSAISLPEHQLEFLRGLRKRLDANTDKAEAAWTDSGFNAQTRCTAGRPRLVVVVTGGCPLELEEVHLLADAVIFAWYPGQEGGTALGEILWGKHSPSGHLSATFPRRLADLPAYEDYNMRGRTYRYQETEVLYPFGYGLSYSEFTLDNQRISEKDDTLEIQADLTNTGKFLADAVPQVYARWPETPDSPNCALVAYARVSLAPGETKKITIPVEKTRLAPVGADGERIMDAAVEVLVGFCAPVPYLRM